MVPSNEEHRAEKGTEEDRIRVNCSTAKRSLLVLVRRLHKLICPIQVVDQLL